MLKRTRRQLLGLSAFVCAWLTVLTGFAANAEVKASPCACIDVQQADAKTLASNKTPVPVFLPFTLQARTY